MDNLYDDFPIYTSYYANRKALSSASDMLLIPISNVIPEWFDMEYLTLPVNVAPPWELINAYKDGIKEYDEFCADYEEYLDETFDVDDIRDSVKELIGNNDGTTGIVFLCFEKDVDNCHRQVFARWLNEDAYCEEL